MKSVKSNSCCTKERPFPKLMIGKNTGNIYLINKDREGTVVSVGRNTCLNLGAIVNNTRYLNLAYYEGDLCLTND